MGQRHQVYMRLPAVAYPGNNPNNRGPVTVGLHHQWLYGRTAIRLLANLMRYHAACAANPRGLKYSPLATDPHGALDLLAACYSFDAAEGYTHSVHKFKAGDSELSNPYMGDNNDGITVIDFADINNPRYCFYTLDGLECEAPGPAPHTCLDACAYVTHYYHGLKGNNGEDLSGWIKPELETLSAYGVLTIADLAEIFPRMDSGKGDIEVTDLAAD